MGLGSFQKCRVLAGMALVGVLVAVAPASAGTVGVGPAVNYAFFAERYINTFSFNGANKITGNIAVGQKSGSLSEANTNNGSVYEDTADVNAVSPSAMSSPAQQPVLPVTLNDLANGFLTLRGGVNDIFLINGTGQLAMNGPSEILFAGGLSANHVLFNVEGTGDLTAINGDAASVVNGTILALRRTVNIATNYSIQGIQGTVGFELNYQPYAPNIPEPATVTLLGFGVAVLFTTKARRKINSQGRGEGP
jgi:hypothetical protein